MFEDKTILLEELSKGKPLAFEKIYELHWRSLLIDANKTIQDKAVAEDIVQETFVNLWNNRRKAKEIQSIGAYLKSSVHYACIKHIQRHINRYNFVELLPDMLDKVVAEYNTLDRLYVQEVENCIALSLKKMPEKVREVFELSRYQGKSRGEIAVELRISPETVKKRIQNALQILKKDLQKLDSYQKASLIFWFLFLN